MGQTISERLEYQSLANRDRQWINDDLYRLLYKADLYILAYERIKSKPGNMTPGTDGETLDGFSMETIQTIIEEMRIEQFRFKPVRTTFIPKANGKMRAEWQTWVDSRCSLKGEGGGIAQQEKDHGPANSASRSDAREDTDPAQRAL